QLLFRNIEDIIIGGRPGHQVVDQRQEPVFTFFIGDLFQHHRLILQLPAYDPGDIEMKGETLFKQAEKVFLRYEIYLARSVGDGGRRVRLIVDEGRDAETFSGGIQCLHELPAFAVAVPDDDFTHFDLIEIAGMSILPVNEIPFLKAFDRDGSFDEIFEKHNRNYVFLIYEKQLDSLVVRCPADGLQRNPSLRPA